MTTRNTKRIGQLSWSSRIFDSMAHSVSLLSQSFSYSDFNCSKLTMEACPSNNWSFFTSSPLVTHVVANKWRKEWGWSPAIPAHWPILSISCQPRRRVKGNRSGPRYENWRRHLRYFLSGPVYHRKRESSADVVARPFGVSLGPLYFQSQRSRYGVCPKSRHNLDISIWSVLSSV